MARKRQLDPDFFRDPEIAKYPPLGRLFYAGTWVVSEDTGVFQVDFDRLKADIFPYDKDFEVKPLYEQIREDGKYLEFVANGVIYAFIRGFHKRQTINHPSLTTLPLPPEPYRLMIPEKIRRCCRFNEDYLSAPVVLTEYSHRVELSRVERVELSRVTLITINNFHNEEIDNLKKIFGRDQRALETHLKARNYPEKLIKDIIPRVIEKQNV